MASPSTRRERALESVWDYPLPPVVQASGSCAQVILNGFLIAESARTVRYLQTGLAPSYYFLPDDVQTLYLRLNGEHEDCPFRGRAAYYDAIVGERVAPGAAWTFREPLRGFEALAGRIAFYPRRVDACLLDGEPVRTDVPDDGEGWVTSAILGLSRGYPRQWDRGEET